MNAPNLHRDAPGIESLAERFIEQLHGGETPTIGQYVQAYPALADEIHDLCLVRHTPTLVNNGE